MKPIFLSYFKINYTIQDGSSITLCTQDTHPLEWPRACVYVAQYNHHNHLTITVWMLESERGVGSRPR